MRFLGNEQSIDDYWTFHNSSLDDYGTKWLSMAASSRWKILALIITTTIILFTVCSNGMTLYAVCKMKKFRSSISNLYIGSLAAADMIVGAFVMTFMMLYTVAYDGVWPFGSVMCDIWQTVDIISCTVSLYSICAIGFDRWLNLEKPLRIFKRNRLIAKRALALVWMAPMITWVPLMIGIRLKSGPPPPGTCSFVWEPKYIVPLVAAPLFYVPVLTLMVLFIRISLVIRSHLVFLHKHSNQNPSTSVFDLDRSAGSSPFGSTPASSRRRSANSPIPGSLVNLHVNGYSRSVGIGGNSNILNGSLCRLQKFKPPPLSPIISVNLTAGLNSSNQTNKEGTGLFDSDFARGPNQSPLAMKVLRDRLSPKTGRLIIEKEKKQQHNGIHSPVFEFPLSGHSETSKPKSMDANEKTPLLNAAAKAQTRKRSDSPKTSQAGLALETEAKDGIGQNDGQRRSISPESIDMPSVVVRCEKKRSSVTSDTAVFFTKRFFSHKPPLLRAKTEMVLETDRHKPRTSARFSIISITTPFFSRKHSMNIFSDMFPNGAGGIAQQIRAAKAVGIIMIFFLISWTPFLVLWPLKVFCPDCVSNRLYQLSIWANYLNSTINPVLYTLCSPRFQRVFRKHCTCCGRRRKGRCKRHAV